MTFLLKAIYRFNEVLIKIPTQFFKKIKKEILTFKYETHLKQKNKWGEKKTESIKRSWTVKEMLEKSQSQIQIALQSYSNWKQNGIGIKADM